jgi:hypothetical protein
MAVPQTIIQSKPSSLPLQKIVLNDFSGGMVTSQPEPSLGPTQYTRLLNIYISETGQLEARSPYRAYLKDTIDTALTNTTKPVLFYHEALGAFATVRAGASYTQIHYWNGSAWTAPSQGTTSYTVAPEVIRYSVGNATDYLIFDPTPSTGIVPKRMAGDGTVSNMGLTAPSTPTTSTAAIDSKTQGIDYDGTYYYKTTFVYHGGSTNTLYGESAPTANASVLVTGCDDTHNATVTVTVAGAATPAIAATVSRVNIYRSPNGQSAGPYKLVGYLLKPGSGWGNSAVTFTDNIPVGEEGIELPDDPCTLVNIKHPFVADGRVWGFDRDIPGKLVYSEPGQPDVFPAFNYFYLQQAGTGITIFNRNLYVFTESSCYVLPNADPEQSNELLKVSDVGTVSHKSLVDVGLGLCWVDARNVYFANFNDQAEDGDFAIPIGRPIEDKIEGIGSTRRSYIVAGLWKDRYYLSFTDSTRVGMPYNTKTFVWDVRTGVANIASGRYGGWSEIDWAFDDFVVYSGNWYFLDVNRKYIYEHGYAVSTTAKDCVSYADTGTTIPIIIRTGLIVLESPLSRKKPHAIAVYGESSGTTLTADFEMNYNAFKTTATLVLGADAIEGDDADDGIWDGSVWGLPPISSTSLYDTNKTKIVFSDIHNLGSSGTIIFTGVDGTNKDLWNATAGVAFTKIDTTSIYVSTPAYNANTIFTNADTDLVDNAEGLDTDNWSDDTEKGYYDTSRCVSNTKGSVMQLNIATSDIADTQLNTIEIYYRETPYTI